MKKKQSRDQIIAQIAKTHLNIETLDNAWDHRDVSCVGVKIALKVAFTAGVQAGIDACRIQ